VFTMPDNTGQGLVCCIRKRSGGTLSLRPMLIVFGNNNTLLLHSLPNWRNLLMVLHVVLKSSLLPNTPQTAALVRQFHHRLVASCPHLLIAVQAGRVFLDKGNRVINTFTQGQVLSPCLVREE
jgi:hypothetical protein